ncbi:MAG TPA: chemotaxis protein CheW, partial [bacterium]|nr:chemotaxis protein CheW [bacterium]
RKSETPSYEKNSRLLRAVHSISGGSSFSGLAEIEKISSKLEKMIYLAISGKIEPCKNFADTIEKTLAVLEEGLRSNGKIKKKEWTKIEKEVERTIFSSSGSTVTEKFHSEIAINFEGETVTFSINDHDVSEKLRSQNLYLLKFDAAADLKEDEISLFQMITILAGEGDILDSNIEIDQVVEESVPIKILYMSSLTLNKLKKLLNFLPAGSINKIDSRSIEETFEIKTEEPYPDPDVEKPFTGKSAENTVQVEEKIKIPVSANDDDAEDQEETASNKYVSFKIGTEHYAVPIEFVYDMKEMLPCSRIPNQPDTYLGVANLRGNVIPVIDLRKVFGIKNVKYDEFTVFLMVRINNKIKGCVVDSIDDVVFLEPENTQIAPALSRKIKTDFVRFIAKEPKTGRFLIVIDVEKMLDNEQ